MSAWRVLSAAFVLALGSAVAHGAPQLPVFRAAADAIAVNVSVRRGNRPVTDLSAADFTVRDNGVTQTLASFVYETLPMDVTVLLDVSGSTAGDVLDQLRRAVLDLLRRLRRDDRLQVLALNGRVRRLAGSAESPVAIDQAFDGLSGGGPSGVLDALAVVLAGAVERDRRQFVALFSDGHDNMSVTTPRLLVELARRSTPTISTVLATPVDGTVTGTYADLAAETGGTVVTLLPDETPTDLLRRALEQFRTSYILGYVPTGVTRGGYHTIDVRVDRPGVEVKARKAYQMPE